MNAEQQQNYSSFTCRHCNAPAVSRICPFCGSDTGLDHDAALENLEYPVLEARDASFDIKSFGILVFIILFLGTIITFMVIINVKARVGLLFTLFILFLMFYELLAIKTLITSIIDYFKVNKLGKEYNCLAFGYFDSTMWVSQEQKYRNKQTLKILVNHEGQNKFILCDTDMIYKKYHENTHLNVKLYKKRYIVYGEAEEIIPL